MPPLITFQEYHEFQSDIGHFLTPYSIFSHLVNLVEADNDNLKQKQLPQHDLNRLLEFLSSYILVNRYLSSSSEIIPFCQFLSAMLPMVSDYIHFLFIVGYESVLVLFDLVEKFDCVNLAVVFN